jgi:glycosyltransferase involved in cell wall biosynthesis
MLPVTVVMTALNAEASIQGAVESVLNQDYSNLELVVIDDGSTDGTNEILARFSDSRLRIVTGRHQGRSAALNMAIAMSKGELIALNDADDVSLPGRISKQALFLVEHEQIDVLNGYMIAFDRSREWILNYPTDNASIQRELNSGRMPISGFLQTDGFEQSLTRLEDFALYYRHRSGTTFAGLDEPLVKYSYKTFGFAQWFEEESKRYEIAESPSKAGLLGYVKYRLALTSQKLGLQLTTR